MRASVVSRGHSISYRSEGSGSPLVLLCGWSWWADTWWDAGYADALADSYKILAIDRLGHGESDKPHDPAEYLEPLIVSDITAVLDAEHVDRAIVWGFSLGAKNAASLAVMEPARVEAVVCGGGGPLQGSNYRRERVIEVADLVKTGEGMTLMLQSIGTSDEGVAESLERNDSAALSACLAGTAEWFPAADDVAAPSLWYMGSDDDEGFSVADLELADRTGVEVCAIPGADHVASFSGAHDVIPLVRPFLDQHRS
jgi:pimeloyl-ACP methyl ester carboxylesterase